MAHYGSIKFRVPDSAPSKDVCFTPFDNLCKIQELVSFKMTTPFPDTMNKQCQSF